jgi:hypothetical protein
MAADGDTAPILADPGLPIDDLESALDQVLGD